MMESFSIIVPVYKGAKMIVKTLNSIEESIKFYYAHEMNGERVKAEIVIVNDASPDQSLDVIKDFTKGKDYYKIISHSNNWGAATARNTGVKFCEGEALFFCDQDDLYLPEHIYLCLWILNYSLSSSKKLNFSPNLPKSISNYLETVQLPVQPVDVVKSQVRLENKIHPYWKKILENVLPINFCIKREAHKFIEGFPEAYVFKLAAWEDTYYKACMFKFLKVFTVDRETVEYVKTSGRTFEELLEMYQEKPGTYQPNLSERQKKTHKLIHKLIEQKLSDLQDKTTLISLAQEVNSATQEKSAEVMTKAAISETIATAIQYQKAGYTEQAKQLYRYILKQELNNDRVLYMLATIALQAGKIEEAIVYYKLALSLTPDFPEAHKDLGRALLQKGCFEEAIEQFQVALATNPNDFELHYHLGLSFQKQGQLELAITYYQQALALEPSDIEVHHHLGQAFHQLGNSEQALAHYQQAVTLLSNFPPVFNPTEILLQQQASFPKPRPKQHSIHHDLALLFEQQGQLEKAITNYQSAISFKPNFFDAHLNVGNIYWQQDEIEKAIFYWEKAFAINPKAPQFEQICQQIIDKQPLLAVAWYFIGVIAFQKGNYEVAIEYIRKAIEISPSNEMLYNNLGAIFTKMGQVEQAMACYQKALELNPNYAKSILASVVSH